MTFATILVILVCFAFLLTLYSAMIASSDFDDLEDDEGWIDLDDDDEDE